MSVGRGTDSPTKESLTRCHESEELARTGKEEKMRDKKRSRLMTV